MLAHGFARPLSIGANQPNNTVMVQVPVILLNELIDAQRRRDVERREWEVERRMFYLADKGQAVRMAEMTVSYSFLRFLYRESLLWCRKMHCGC